MNTKRLKLTHEIQQVQVRRVQELYLHAVTYMDMIFKLDLLVLCGRHGYESDEYVKQRKLLGAIVKAVFYSFDEYIQTWLPSSNIEPPFTLPVHRPFWMMKYMVPFILWKVQDCGSVELLKIFREHFLDELSIVYDNTDSFSVVTKLQWAGIMKLLDSPPVSKDSTEAFIALNFLQQCFLMDIVPMFAQLKKDVRSFARVRTFVIDTQVSDRKLIYDPKTLTYRLPAHMCYEHGLDNPEIHVLNKQVRGTKTMFGTGDARNVAIFRRFLK